MKELMSLIGVAIASITAITTLAATTIQCPVLQTNTTYHHYDTIEDGSSTWLVYNALDMDADPPAADSVTFENLLPTWCTDTTGTSIENSCMVATVLTLGINNPVPQCDWVQPSPDGTSQIKAINVKLKPKNGYRYSCANPVGQGENYQICGSNSFLEISE